MNHDVNDVNKKMYQLQLSIKIALLQQRLLGVNISEKEGLLYSEQSFQFKKKSAQRSTQADLQQT